VSLLVVAAPNQKWGVHGVYSLFLVEREGEEIERETLFNFN